MLDSNIYDQLLVRAELYGQVRQLLDAGALTVLTTHVQRDELVATPDLEKRRRLVGLWDDISTPVPTGAAVTGVSRTGESRTTHEEDVLVLEALRFRGRDAEDALIAHAALTEQAVLVTAETKRRGLVEHARRAGVPVWSLEEFADQVAAAVGALPSTGSAETR